jgi:tetratricopeptide (TPR) repeat protein
MIPEHVVLLRRERWLPLEDLFEVEVSSTLYNEADKRSVFYAQSWALVHYLLARPERSAALFDFLGRVRDGQGVASAFRAAFGMAPGTLESDLRRYVEQPDWPVQRYSLGAGVGAASSGARPMRDADVFAALGGLQWRLGRQDEAIGLAQLAVDADPACAAGWALLAVAEVDRFMDVEAVPWLLKAAALPAGDPFTAYLVGAVTLRIQERAGETTLPRGEALPIARRVLEEATSKMPAYAEAWASLSHAALADGHRAEQALDAARRARTLAPTRRHYLLLEAQALMQQDDLQGARRLMEDLLEHDAGTPLADKAGEVLVRIDALQEARARR